MNWNRRDAAIPHRRGLTGEPPTPPSIEEIRKLATRLNDAREELEADLQAIANDARHEGVLVVLPWSETMDMSWIQCCSRVGDCPNCQPGDFTRKPKKSVPRMDRRDRW